MDAVDHGRRVLGTILASKSVVALDYARRHLSQTSFVDATQVELFRFMCLYQDQTNFVLPGTALRDMLRARPEGTILAFGEYYRSLMQAQQAAPDEFKWSVLQLGQLAAERRTADVIAQGMEILTAGARKGKVELKGDKDARNWMIGELSSIDRELASADSPEGDIRREKDEVLAAVQKAMGEYQAGRRPGVPTGLDGLDAVLGGGLGKGELCLVSGFTSVGKTSACMFFAHHAAMRGINTVVFTTETLRPQCRIKLVARHSRELDEYGINTRLIKSGALNGEQLALLNRSLDDLAQLPGAAYVAQLPPKATIATIEADLRRITRHWPAGLVIIDYLALLRATAKRQSKREEIEEILQDAKALAGGYNDGEGVPVISPWQISRDGHNNAGENGYSLTGLAQSHEASAISDVILSLRDKNPAEPDGRLELAVLKNRDGERRVGQQAFTVSADYGTCFFRMEGDGRSYDDVLFGREDGFGD